MASSLFLKSLCMIFCYRLIKSMITNGQLLEEGHVHPAQFFNWWNSVVVDSQFSEERKVNVGYIFDDWTTIVCKAINSLYSPFFYPWRDSPHFASIPLTPVFGKAIFTEVEMSFFKLWKRFKLKILILEDY